MVWNGIENRKNNHNMGEILARIDERLANFISAFDRHMIEDEKKFQEYSTRLGKIEFWQMKMIGALIIISIILQVAFGLKR